MKEYNPNIRWGTHTIEVTFQQYDYTGKLSYEVGGNTKGAAHFEDVADHISWAERFVENNVKFETDGEWFSVTLVNEVDEELLVEDELDFLEDLIVGVKIISFSEEREAE